MDHHLLCQSIQSPPPSPPGPVRFTFFFRIPHKEMDHSPLSSARLRHFSFPLAFHPAPLPSFFCPLKMPDQGSCGMIPPRPLFTPPLTFSTLRPHSESFFPAHSIEPFLLIGRIFSFPLCKSFHPSFFFLSISLADSSSHLIMPDPPPVFFSSFSRGPSPCTTRRSASFSCSTPFRR